MGKEGGARWILIASAALALLALSVGCSLPFSKLPFIPSSSSTPGGETPDSTQSVISGTVTDMSTGRPQAGIAVSVSGFPPVHTDGQGRYAVAGLPAGQYSLSLKLGDQEVSAQGPVFVNVDGQNSVTVDLAYYGQPQPLPTDTPLPAVTPAATPLPRLPVSGTPFGYGPLVVLGLGLLLILVGGLLRATDLSHG